MKRFKDINLFKKILLGLILILGLSSCTPNQSFEGSGSAYSSSEEMGSMVDSQTEGANVEEDKAYYKMEDVAAYIYFYNKLPKNYLTKKEARDLGWIPKENNLWEVTDKGVIGGDHFGNYEKTLPQGSYKEADVNYYGGARGPERLVYDKDGNIFYTRDHYETFERIY